MQPVGAIRELWRYPVKSMAGERLDAVEVTAGGLLGDRQWAVRDEDKGVITSGKRLPGLMMCAARYVDATADAPFATVDITLPDGGRVRSDDPDVHRRLSEALGRTLRLCALRPASDADHYRTPKLTAAEMREMFAVPPGEPLPDLSMLPASLLGELYRFATPRGTYYDCFTLHLLTTASLAEMRARAPGADMDARRFRPNILVDSGTAAGLLELTWCGGTLRAGGVTARIEVPTVRCAMPTRPQPGLSADPSVLRAVVEHAERCLGAYGSVDQAGRIAVGDEVTVQLPRRTGVGRALQSGATSLKRLALKAAARTLRDK